MDVHEPPPPKYHTFGGLGVGLSGDVKQIQPIQVALTYRLEHPGISMMWSQLYDVIYLTSILLKPSHATKSYPDIALDSTLSNASAFTIHHAVNAVRDGRLPSRMLAILNRRVVHLGKVDDQMWDLCRQFGQVGAAYLHFSLPRPSAADVPRLRSSRRDSVAPLHGPGSHTTQSKHASRRWPYSALQVSAAVWSSARGGAHNGRAAGHLRAPIHAGAHQRELDLA